MISCPQSQAAARTPATHRTKRLVLSCLSRSVTVECKVYSSSRMSSKAICVCIGNADTLLLLRMLYCTYIPFFFHSCFTFESFLLGNKCDRLETLTRVVAIYGGSSSSSSSSLFFGNLTYRTLLGVSGHKTFLATAADAL